MCLLLFLESTVFARVLDAINKWTLHPNLHVSTFCALSQLCCALLKGKVGRMNINRMLDSSSDVCLSLGETQRKFPGEQSLNFEKTRSVMAILLSTLVIDVQTSR